jgi:hypothetical protein
MLPSAFVFKGKFIGVLTHLLPMLPSAFVFKGSFIGVLTHLLPMLPFLPARRW